MIKLLWLLILASVACRLLSGLWPWQLLKAADRSAELARARNLLGVSPDTGREGIIDAHRALVSRVHPDRGGSNEAVHEANSARDLLLAQAERDARNG